MMMLRSNAEMSAELEGTLRMRQKRKSPTELFFL